MCEVNETKPRDKRKNKHDMTLVSPLSDSSSPNCVALMIFGEI